MLVMESAVLHRCVFFTTRCNKILHTAYLTGGNDGFVGDYFQWRINSYSVLWSFGQQDGVCVIGNEGTLQCDSLMGFKPLFTP